MSIKTLAQKVIDLYAQEKCAGDDDLFQALVDLGDQAKAIVQMEDALAALWKEAPDGPAHRAAFEAMARTQPEPAPVMRQITDTAPQTNMLADRIMDCPNSYTHVWELAALLTNRPKPHDEWSREWDRRVEVILAKIPASS